MVALDDTRLLKESRHRFSIPEIPDGLTIIDKSKHFDFRGSFQEELNFYDLQQLGFNGFFQKNISISKSGVVRGMHWQSGDYAQAKIVSCIQGSVIDVVIDLRLTSVTFGSINSFKLVADNPRHLRIPKGFAHGFQALEDDTIFSYYVDAPYNPKSEMCLSPLSLELESYWESLPRIVNQKDQNSMNFIDFISAHSKEKTNE